MPIKNLKGPKLHQIGLGKQLKTNVKSKVQPDMVNTKKLDVYSKLYIMFFFHMKNKIKYIFVFFLLGHFDHHQFSFDEIEDNVS